MLVTETLLVLVTVVFVVVVTFEFLTTPIVLVSVGDTVGLVFDAVTFAVKAELLVAAPVIAFPLLLVLLLLPLLPSRLKF